MLITSYCLENQKKTIDPIPITREYLNSYDICFKRNTVERLLPRKIKINLRCIN